MHMPEQQKDAISITCQSCQTEIRGDSCPSCGMDFAEAATYDDPLLGTSLNNRYRLDSLLGFGGWGMVYKARDLELERTVAVKLLHKHWVPDKQKLKRFQSEAKAL